MFEWLCFLAGASIQSGKKDLAGSQLGAFPPKEHERFGGDKIKIWREEISYGDVRGGGIV